MVYRQQQQLMEIQRQQQIQQQARAAAAIMAGNNPNFLQGFIPPNNSENPFANFFSQNPLAAAMTAVSSASVLPTSTTGGGGIFPANPPTQFASLSPFKVSFIYSLCMYYHLQNI